MAFVEILSLDAVTSNIIVIRQVNFGQIKDPQNGGFRLRQRF
jgi:hypothetical protein